MQGGGIHGSAVLFGDDAPVGMLAGDGPGLGRRHQQGERLGADSIQGVGVVGPVAQVYRVRSTLLLLLLAAPQPQKQGCGCTEYVKQFFHGKWGLFLNHSDVTGLDNVPGVGRGGIPGTEPVRSGVGIAVERATAFLFAAFGSVVLEFKMHVGGV